MPGTYLLTVLHLVYLKLKSVVTNDLNKFINYSSIANENAAKLKNYFQDSF